MIAAHDGSPRPLTCKLLQRPRVLQAIRSRDDLRVFLHAYLPFSYGRRGAHLIRAAAPLLVAAMREAPPRVPAAVATARPRLVAVLAQAATCDRDALIIVALVLLVATSMGGLAPQGCRPASNFAPSAVALADIPGNYLGWIRAAAPRYGLDWTVIAGIYSIETDFGRLEAPGVRSGENFAGPGGPGQFLVTTWGRYGVDGDGDGVSDRYDPADAIPGTANLLRQNGAPSDYDRAIFAYNHAGWYVRRGAVARGTLPRRRPGQSERRRELRRRRRRRRRAGSGVRECGYRASRPQHRRPAHIARRVSRAPGMGDGGRPRRRARGRPDLRRRPLGPAPVRASRLGGARGRPPHTWGRHRGGSCACGGCYPGRLGCVGGPFGERARLDTELWQLRCPAGVPAQARDPVGRLRRLPESRLAANLHGRMPRPHPCVMGVRLLWLERACSAM